MVGLPSRLSASASQRLSRRAQLELARRQDKLENYSGVRVNSQGRRFQIHGARIWSLIDQERHYQRQAACFSHLSRGRQISKQRHLHPGFCAEGKRSWKDLPIRALGAKR